MPVRTEGSRRVADLLRPFVVLRIANWQFPVERVAPAARWSDCMPDSRVVDMNDYLDGSGGNLAGTHVKC